MSSLSEAIRKKEIEILESDLFDKKSGQLKLVSGKEGKLGLYSVNSLEVFSHELAFLLVKHDPESHHLEKEIFHKIFVVQGAGLDSLAALLDLLAPKERNKRRASKINKLKQRVEKFKEESEKLKGDLLKVLKPTIDKLQLRGELFKVFKEHLRAPRGRLSKSTIHELIEKLLCYYPQFEVDSETLRIYISRHKKGNPT
jgi:hypothetical protein